MPFEEVLVRWLEERIQARPGCTTRWLFENRPMIGREYPIARDFDDSLEVVRQRGYRTANGVWWPKGYVGTRREPRAPRTVPHPRQLNLLGEK